jgi:hypothetical protein
LQGLLSAYQRRRGQELRQLGGVINLAMGEHPEQLDKLTAPPAPAPASATRADDDEYVAKYW